MMGPKGEEQHPGRLTWNLKMWFGSDDFPFQLGDF